ncbi:MAG TPA: dihydropyrimidinase [Chthoniobacterales bacterium]|nr:dihydropyrimidinase [Chthoniobacterales bacterium]
MREFELLIQGGLVVTDTGSTRCDVGVADGRILALAEKLANGRQIIDANGLLVLPGGIDSHVHIAQPSGASINADDFHSGTMSAAFGGTTTILPFALQQRDQSLLEAVQDYHQKATGRSFVDYSFHPIVTNASETVINRDLPGLIRDGYRSVKVFMTYEHVKLSELELLKVMDVAREQDGLVMVHCENDGAIRYAIEKLEEEGKIAPQFHAASHPAIAEVEAVNRVITFAEWLNVPVMVVHVSTRGAMESIRRARQRGLKVFGETCPQYLLFTAKDLERPNLEGTKYIFSPPPRDKKTQEACWEGLSTDVLSVFSSDHCPFRFEGKGGKQTPPVFKGFRFVPNGIPGVETRLPLLFSEGVGKGRITLNQFVALSSTNHAKIYGLYPQKGTIAVGADADLALWNPEREVTISQSVLHHGCDYTPYEGLKVKGWPMTTILRGQVIVRDGKLEAKSGTGIYLKQNPPKRTAIGIGL